MLHLRTDYWVWLIVMFLVLTLKKVCTTEYVYKLSIKLLITVRGDIGEEFVSLIFWKKLYPKFVKKKLIEIYTKSSEGPKILLATPTILLVPVSFPPLAFHPFYCAIHSEFPLALSQAKLNQICGRLYASKVVVRSWLLVKMKGPVIVALVDGGNRCQSDLVLWGVSGAPERYCVLHAALFFPTSDCLFLW